MEPFNAMYPLVTGTALNVLQYDPEDNKWNFSVRKFGSVLMRPEVRDKPVVIVSAVGKKRIGKSLLLNYSIRYLEREGREGWMGSEEEAAEGFLTASGDDSVTEGIWIWSQPFIRKLPDGREVAVILMDTEGLYGDGRDTNVSSRIFGISTALSSVQIFNLHEGLDASDLLNLRLFIGLGQIGLGSKTIGRKPIVPFQKLWFLVRSWRFPKRHGWGATGGESYLNSKLLAPTVKDTEGIKLTKYAIIQAYSEIRGYLMPDPGDERIYSSDFKGQRSLFSEHFADQLSDFIKRIFSEDNLIPKKVCEERISGKQVYAMFEAIEKKATSGLFPTVPDIQTATCMTFRTILLQQLTDSYNEKIEQVTASGADNVLDPTEFLDFHVDTKDGVLQYFDQMDKLMTDEEAALCRVDLRTLLDLRFLYYCEQNGDKLEKVRKKWLTGAAAAAATGATTVVLTVGRGFAVETFIACTGLAIGSGPLLPVLGAGVVIASCCYSAYNMYRFLHTKDSDKIVQNQKKVFMRLLS